MPFLPDTNVWIRLVKNPAEIRHQLEVLGRVIGRNDLKIAAIARAYGLTLVSADQGFGQVPGLGVEDWSHV